MKYLSLFSGIGGFELGIRDAFPGAECVGYSEIDKHAIKVYQSHFPEHKNYGDIKDVNINSLPDFDMLVGGFPCQDLSIAKANRKGLDGDRSGLFWNMLDVLRTKKPRYFCFENVASMAKKDRDIITNKLGVEPLMINAALVSAQSRKRLFWCNWEVKQPKDRMLILNDILEENPNVKPLSDAHVAWLKSPSGKKRIDMGMLKINPEKVVTLTARGYLSWGGNYVMHPVRLGNINNSESQGNRIYSVLAKAVTLSANGGGLGAKTGIYLVYNGKYWILRMLSPIECERLQCFPDNWTQSCKNTQRYKQLGNAVNVEVVKHIMNELRRNNESGNTICN